MATNHTQNYQLNLWEPTDRFLRSEFNENTQTIEDALVGHDAALANLTNAKADAVTVNASLAALQTAVNGKAEASAVAALQTAVNGKADAGTVAALSAAQLRYQHFTYVGNGTKVNALSFDFEPMLVFIVPFGDSSNGAAILFRGQTEGMPVRTSSGNDRYSAKWEGNTLTLTVNPTYKSYATCLAVLQNSEITYGVFAVG